MDIETKTDLGRPPLEIITPLSVFHMHPGLSIQPTHPKQNCTHWKISSAFLLYFIISCSAFCLLPLEMYCLTRVRRLFYFSFSYTFHFNHVESVNFLFTCLLEEPGNLGQMEEQDMFRQRNWCGRAGNWEMA